VHGVTYHGSLQEDAQFEQTLESLEAHVVQLIADLTGGNLTVNPRVACPAYCPVRTVCRFDAGRIEPKLGCADQEATSE
jgi:ATP-dependent helicase/DNAse subunit B